MYHRLSDSWLTDCIDRLRSGHSPGAELYRRMLTDLNDEQILILHNVARKCTDEVYGRGVFIRGLIEISNYCKNGCYYCGIRCGNTSVERYRLSIDQILESCELGYELGFRSFVLQGGEDPVQNDDWVEEAVRNIKSRYPDCAVTLSVGERSDEAYARFRAAGADRYLLRHETADATHYAGLHPRKMSWDNRVHCLFRLKELGYQTGAGMMVGSPGQTVDHLVQDLLFLERLQPEMIGIGPFIPAPNTPFSGEPAGTVRQTLLLLSLLRLRFPKVLLPATTALATLDPQGQEKGFAAGANVVMPNLSPLSVRSKYALYDKKKHTGSEAGESIRLLEEKLNRLGLHIAYGRGDYKR